MTSRKSSRLLRQVEREWRASPRYLARDGHHETVFGRRDLLESIAGDTPVAAELDRLIRSGTLIKHDATSTVARAQLGGVSVIIKRYNKRGAIHNFKMLVSTTRAEKAFFKTLLLRTLDIPTPEPLLYCVVRRWGIAATSYLVTACSRGEPLCDLFDAGRIDSESWQGAASQAGEIIRRLHRHGITHGDIKTPNLLFHNGVEIIDLDAMRVHWSATRFRRFAGKDLEAFARRVEGYPERNGVK